MGKNLIQQRRGKGSPTFKKPSHNFKGSVKHRRIDQEIISGVIKDIVHCPGHSSPLAIIRYEDNIQDLILAPEGVKVGDSIQIGQTAKADIGNILPLKNIPEGTSIYNIESRPGDGGKFVRSSGAAARIVLKTADKITIQLPSKKQKVFHPECMACIGIIAGGGRREKPFYKAGKKFHATKAKGTYWPKVSGQAMNAISHPFGGSRSSRKGRPTIAPKHAPPGRNVGMIRARRTGRKKR